jgi:hypothetical protein
MKKHKLPVLGLGLMLMIASCKKTDVQQESTLGNPAVAATTASAIPASSTTNASEWKTLSNWASSKQEKFTTYSSKIEDASITSAVTSSGLILAFAKNGSSIQAMPFQQKGTNDSYWYYQVSKGSITFSCDAYSGTQSLNDAGFTYFVLSAEQLKDLAANGHSKTQLMQLSYENLATLLKK